MKLKKCWLSTKLAVALLAALIAKAQSGEAPSTPSPEVVDSRMQLDASIFEKGAATAEKYQFGAEASRILDLFGKSVYTGKEAVVRELLSNAIDAIKKQYEHQLSKASEIGMDDIANYKVTVQIDKENNIISFTDDGVGMTHDELKNFLGTIAKSGTAEFSGKLKKGNADSSNMIGQFGVGFYSVLLVAEKVAVISKSDNDPKQWIWETDSSAAFRIFEDPSGPTLGRGTRIMLKVKSDSIDFLDHDKVEKMMKKYFSYDRHRIYLLKPKTIEVEEEESEVKEVKEEQGKEEADQKKDEQGEEKKEEGKDADGAVEVNDEKKQDEKPKVKKVKKTVIEDVLISQNIKPIWQRSPAEVKPEEYHALYKTISDDKHGKPIAYTHFSGETAKSESFRAVLFIPERAPFSPFNPAENDKTSKIKLHVRGVFVTAKFEDFIPKHLSFVSGIIDSDDISLNISREIIQDTNELRGIKKKIIKKIISMMSDMAAEDGEKYKKFYDSYSSFIKLEIADHDDYRAPLSKLLLYRSTTTTNGRPISLEKYIERMPEAQKEKKVIYFLAGREEDMDNSPFLGRFKEKGYEVLLMTDPVDEHVIQRMEKYEDYKFENIAKDGIKLDEDEEKEAKELDEKFKISKEWLGAALKESVEKVILVPGPVNIPGSIKTSQYGWTGNMERLVSAQSSSKDDPMLGFFAKQKKILELNPKNPVIASILEKSNDSANKPDAELKDTVRTLVDSMMIWSGYAVRDASRFATGIDRMTKKVLGLSVEPLPEEETVKAEAGDDKGSEDDDVEERDMTVHDAAKIAAEEETLKKQQEEPKQSPESAPTDSSSSTASKNVNEEKEEL